MMGERIWYEIRRLSQRFRGRRQECTLYFVQRWQLNRVLILEFRDILLYFSVPMAFLSLALHVRVIQLATRMKLTKHFMLVTWYKNEKVVVRELKSSKFVSSEES